MVAKRKVTWEEALEEAFRSRARELDLLREHDLKHKAAKRPQPKTA